MSSRTQRPLFYWEKNEAGHLHYMWTAGKALYLKTSTPQNLSDVRLTKSSDVMDGDIAQWFGLSFHRPIQDSVTLFFELSIFALFFSALIFFFIIIVIIFKILPFLSLHKVTQDSTAPYKQIFYVLIFGEKNVNQTAWVGIRWILEIRL